MLNENNLAIIGSRGFNNFTHAKKEILKLITNNHISITKIISGGADGTDKIAEIFAEKFNIPVEIIKPDWSKGKQAGVIRNSEIIKKSDVIIAFWDGKSKGTLDSINKAKKYNKRIFVIKIDPNSINEGIRMDNNDDFVFDYKKDNKDDILKLKYNKEYLTTKITKGLKSYFSYKINKNIDKTIRLKLLNHIKFNLKNTNQYEQFLNKAVIGLFNNPNIELMDIDLIIIPTSSSNLNLDLANKINNKIPNNLFLKDGFLKNDIENVTINYDALKEKKYSQDTILGIEKMIRNAIVGDSFKIKKIPPRFRRFILNFLKINVNDERILNKLINGKILIVDDFISEGTTFNEINRIIDNFSPKEIIMYSLIG